MEKVAKLLFLGATWGSKNGIRNDRHVRLVVNGRHGCQQG
jgi:hypothetical protein